MRFNARQERRTPLERLILWNSGFSLSKIDIVLYRVEGFDLNKSKNQFLRYDNSFIAMGSLCGVQLRQIINMGWPIVAAKS